MVQTWVPHDQRSGEPTRVKIRENADVGITAQQGFIQNEREHEVCIIRRNKEHSGKSCENIHFKFFKSVLQPEAVTDRPI